MKEKLLAQIEKHIHAFFQTAKLNRKKWYKDINNHDELLYSFFVLRRRMIQAKNYIIHESNKMNEIILKPEANRDYQALKKALSEKGDLKKFHTENSKILYPIDGLLEEWNINHLHIDRSRYQVFFMAEQKEIFMIHVCKHFERNRTGYSQHNLLEIIKENWPEKLLEKKSAVLPAKYNSQYGWDKVQEIYTWLDNLAHVIEKNNTRPEIVFMANEKFVLCDMETQDEIPEATHFDA